MSSFQFAIVDAFCVPGESFTGNQAAVCLLPSDDIVSDEVKQKIAAEINLSETAFVSRSWLKDGEPKLTLRWFTPETEVTLCGHATLATARVLFDNNTDTRKEFATKFKGTLAATMDRSTDRISLDFPLAPSTPFTASHLDCLPQLLTQLLDPISSSEIHSMHYSKSTKKLLVRLNGEASESNVNESTLLKLKPNFSGLVNVKGNNMVMGIIVTMKGSGEVNFYSRYFAPWVGLDEDPVTGSAHTVLAAYWGSEYKGSELLGKQCSKRSGLVWCKLQEPGRVRLEGFSKFVVKGHIEV